MIDKQKLADAFLMIGKDRIPYYIDLFIFNNRKFQIRVNRLYKKKDWITLFNLLHKTRGSLSFFYTDGIIDLFTNLEEKIKSTPDSIENSDIELLLRKYDEFLRELEGIKKEYS